MGIFKKAADAVKPKDINLQIAETTQKLMKLESKFTVIIRKERNVVKTAKSRAAKTAAEERLRNAYVSLRLVHTAQERLYDISSTYELTESIKDLSAAMGIINRINNKADVKGLSALFLKFRTNKLLNNTGAAEDGGMKQYFESSIEEILMGDTAMDKLVHTDFPLQAILKEDEETQDNLDDFNDFLQSPDFDLKNLDVADDLDSLINDLD